MDSFENFSDFNDIEALIKMPQVNSVTFGGPGRVVAAISESDQHGSRLRSSLWELDSRGKSRARQLTFSAEGESSPWFCPDGSLLFTSKRPSSDGGPEMESMAIWRLPDHGEAVIVAALSGDLSICGVAEDGAILATTSVLAGSGLEGDAQRRKNRKDARRTTIWHTGMPIRRYDHEVGDFSSRLVLIHPDGQIIDLAPDAGVVSLVGATADISPDGRQVVTSWTERVQGGSTRTSLVLIDTQTLERTTFLAGSEEQDFDTPVFSPAGDQVAVTRTTTSTPTDPRYSFLEIHTFAGGDPVDVEVGDLTAKEYIWTPSSRLLVAGDLYSSGAILAADPHTGTVETLAADGVFTSLASAEDGVVYALRNDIATPPRPVRLSEDSGQIDLPAPGAIGPLPGSLERVETDVDGVQVGGWLCTPDSATASEPAPAMLWIHGGPHSSYNTWGWRWCPWLAVARGYTVLMPDPAMSTGYGHSGLKRGWPRLPDVVFNECETLFDEVLGREEIDRTRTAMLGGSFGGFMANWIAGHTDRFDAIVSHASLWALDQQHRTTDMAAAKMRVHGHEGHNADWYRKYSPHYSASDINTPMLITHGNQDYRVPVSESVRMWWDLVSGWDGPPEAMPHRFLQMTSENHAIVTPSNIIVWVQVVLAFCDQHVLGADPVPDALPE